MSTPEDLNHIKHGSSPFPVEELLLRRWSPRAFADKPVSDESLESIFSAASWAASSYNEQPWRFLVGRQGDETWTKIFAALLPFNQGWAKSAPVLYTGFAKKTFSHNGAPNGVAVHDLGAASSNASLQATSLGLLVHGIGGFDRDGLRSAFSVPEDFEPISCWALGYLGDPETLPENFKTSELQPRARKPLTDILFKTWGEAAIPA